MVLGAGLDNQHTFTTLMWVYRTGDTDGRRLFSKGTDEEKACFAPAGGTDSIRFGVKRATTFALATSNNAVFPQNVWTYLAVTYDSTDGPRIFRGTLTTTAAEVAYSGTRTVGVGAETSDSGQPWTIGQSGDPADYINSFEGRIAFVGHYRRRFPLAEVIAYQFSPIPDADCDIFMHLGWNDTGTQANWGPLGAGINGTVTGATVGDHAPLPPPVWMGDTPVFAAAPVVGAFQPAWARGANRLIGGGVSTGG